MAGVIAIMMITGLWDQFFGLYKRLFDDREQFEQFLLLMKMAGVTIMVTPLFFLMSAFLRGDISFGSADLSLPRWETERQQSALQAELDLLKRQVEQNARISQEAQRTAHASEDEARIIVRKIAPEVTLEMLKHQVSAKVMNLAFSDHVEKTWREMEGNLRAAVASSRRHQITNLIIGGLGSAIAVIFYTYLYMTPETESRAPRIGWGFFATMLRGFR